ncbi:hypothetical protein HZC00_00525 [Candidatus Kaiserbacteria bacterium]|nr:hypothetical protein [Candidatus Kaiserbacteria bacterium]
MITSENLNKTGALQVAGCQDLALALSGEEGRFVVTTPDGTTLIADVAAGHSITGLRILPKMPSLTTFSFVKVGEMQKEAYEISGQPGSESEQS